MVFRCPAVDFRWRGVVGRICPARERSPRRRPPDTAHERKNLPRAETLPTAKASRHSARAKEFAPQGNALLGEGLSTRRTSQRICPAQEHAPRRRPLDTAHEPKDLPRAGTRPSTKVSRHGARAKGFAPRRNAPLGEGLPTRRTSERICPRRNTPHGKGLSTRHTSERICPRARRLSSAKASRHSARAKGFAPRRNTPLGECLPTRRTGERVCPAGFAFAPRGDERRAALDRRTAGKTPLRRGRTREGAAAAEFIHRKKIRLLHEIQLFYGESHVGSRQIFPSFPSVGRCVARERNPVPPFAPHRGRGHRNLRRDGEMCHGFGEMVRRFDECPRGGKSLPRGGNAWPRGGGRRDPGLRCFGERFHRLCRANPDACRGRRYSRGHDDLGQRAFRYFRPAFRNPLCDNEKAFRGPRCSRGQDDLGRRAFRCSRPTFRNRRRSDEKNFRGRRCSRG